MKREIIKIGGSILFDSRGKLKRQTAKPLLDLISQIKPRVILVIGCGEKMHRRTIAANLTDKPADKNRLLAGSRLKEAFSLYHDIQQNLADICELGGQNLFKPVHPAHIFVKRSRGRENNEIVWFGRDLFLSQSDPEILVTSGGIVTDREILFSAISSDTIAAYLASELYASRLVMLTSTRGIYTSKQNSSMVSIIREEDLSKYEITGGMKDKLRRIKRTVRRNMEIFIASGELRLARELLIDKKTDNCTRVE